MIISASRRTDIPAFYGEWFAHRLKAGWCKVRNPFSSQVYHVSLQKKDVLGWVFWSRNYQPFLPVLRRLFDDGQRFLCHYTINGFPRALEPRTIAANRATEIAREIAGFYGSQCVSWRYDPILLTSATPPDWHLGNFSHIADALAGATKRCYFSFPCMYAKTRRNLKTVEQETEVRTWSIAQGDFEEETLQYLIRRLAKIADERGIKMYSCCGVRWVSEEIPIYNSHCVDWPLLQSMRREEDGGLVKRHPTRKDCGCYKSVDIGRYDTCTHGCKYCYAVSNSAHAQHSYETHRSEDSIL